MEKIKNNFIYAIKNIRYHLKDYSCFFIAVFVIQTVLGIISFCYYNNNAIDYQHATAEYTNHITLENLNFEQYDHFINNNKYSNRQGDLFFEISKVVKRNNGERYDVYVTFTKNPVKYASAFENRYYSDLEEYSDGNYSIIRTPLLEYETSVKSNRRIQILTIFAVFICSFFLMTRLFSVRLNHYKFTYGIYMTFGADFKKLFSSSKYELLFITLITYIPSALLTLLISFLIYRNSGAVFHVTAMPFFNMFVLSLVISFASVYLPIKRLSRVAPVAALSAADNSNLVLSPRVSSERIRKSFPWGYVFNTLIRFRRYFAGVILFGVVFCAAFVGGAYFSEVYADASEYNYPRFSLDFSNGANELNIQLRDKILSIDGVTDVVKSQTMNASYANSHIVLSRSQTAMFSGFLSRRFDGKNSKITNCLQYNCLDGEIVTMLEKYEHAGNITDALTNENTVVISDTRYNAKALKLDVGDKIRIATYLYSKTLPESYETGNDFLNQQLDCNAYSYREYTVGAVIHGMSTGADINVYLAPSDYAAVTGNTFRFQSADIYTDGNLSEEKVQEIYAEIRSYVDNYDNVSVNDNSSAENLHIKEKNIPLMFIIIAFLILLISPVLWIFSQVMFCFKREEEIFVLESMGATPAQIKKMYFSESAIYALVSTVLYTVFSLIISFAVWKAANMILVYPGFDFHIPLVPFTVGLSVALISAFASGLIPYAVYIKKKNTLVGALSEDSE